MADPASQFEAMLAQMMSENGDVRKPAERAFAESAGNADEWAHLMMHTLVTSQDVDIRGFTAVMFRQKTWDIVTDDAAVWLRMSPAVREEIKVGLLAALDHESDRLNARKICDCVGEAYAYMAQKRAGEWPELLPSLFRWSQSGTPNVRECALVIFSRLAAFTSAEMRRYYTVLKEIFEAALVDPEGKVRLAGLVATSMFLCTLDDEAKAERAYFEPLLPPMLEVIGIALNSEAEVDAMKAIQQFIDIAELDPTFFRRHLDVIVNSMLQIVTATQLDNDGRHLAVEFLTVLAEKAFGMVRKSETYMTNVLPALLNMMVELGDEDDEAWQLLEEDDVVDVVNPDFAEQAIDRIACSLGGQAILPQMFQLIPTLLKDTNWRFRHAGLMAISAFAEGTSEQLEAQLGEIVTMGVPFLQDPHPRVRYAACQCFGQLCIDFEPDFQDKYHGDMIPPLMALMADYSSPRTQAHAAAAMINLCQKIDRSLLGPHLDSLLGRLYEMLRDGKTKVQEQALAAIGAIADVAKEHFHNYYDVFVPLLKQILFTAVGQEHRILRGRAAEELAIIGLAVGRERFGADAIEVMNLFVQMNVHDMEPEDPQIAYLMDAWGRIAECLQEEFVPYLRVVMPPLLREAKMKATMTIADTDDPQKLKPGWENLFLGDTRCAIKTSALEEKATACRQIGIYARELGVGFFQYVAEVSRICIDNLSYYFHDGVRIACSDALPFLLHDAMEAAQQGMTDAAFVHGLLNESYEKLLEVVHAEPDLEVLTSLLQGVSGMIVTAGDFGLSEEHTVKTIQHLAQLLNDAEKRHVERERQRHDDEDYDEQAEVVLTDGELVDDVVQKEIAQIVNSLFKTRGARFLPQFESELLETYQKLLHPSRHARERRWAVCVFDDCFEYASPDSHRLMPLFRDLMVQYMTDPQAEVRQAACYGFGICAQHAGPLLVPVIPQALVAMRQVILREDADSRQAANASDNALSAMVKLCHYLPDATPVAEVLPFVIQHLPMNDDTAEAQYVYGVLLGLVEENNPLALGEGGANIPKLFSSFVEALGTDLVTDELTERIVHFVKQIQASAPDACAAMVGTLKEESQAKVRTIFEGNAA